MTALKNSSLTTLAIGLFAFTGLAAASPAADVASHMEDFVDCSDSFWAVTCEDDAMWGTADVTPMDKRVRIDADPTCEPFGDDLIICHT